MNNNNDFEVGLEIYLRKGLIFISAGILERSSLLILVLTIPIINEYIFEEMGFG